MQLASELNKGPNTPTADSSKIPVMQAQHLLDDAWYSKAMEVK